MSLVRSRPAIRSFVAPNSGLATRTLPLVFLASMTNTPGWRDREVVDVAASAGHTAVVQDHRRPVCGALLERLRDRLLPQLAAVKGHLMLRWVAQCEQQSPDPWMVLADST